MNWLAHLYLSERSAEFRIGNLLPDLIGRNEWMALPPGFVRGAECHCRIDRFTDSHPLARQSRERLGPEFRRYSGIIVDVFYDHLLAVNWNHYSAVPLREFAAEVYASFDQHRSVVPAEAMAHLERIRAHDLLCCYVEIAGLREALRRLGARLRKPVALDAAVPLLERDHADFARDFRQFFPELIVAVRG